MQSFFSSTDAEAINERKSIKISFASGKHVVNPTAQREQRLFPRQLGHKRLLMLAENK